MMKIIAVTGATSDIGKDIVTYLLDSGYKVVLIGRNKVKLDSIASSLRVPDKYVYCFDNDELTGVKSLFSNIVKNTGKLDGLICCAGSHEVKPLKISKSVDFSNAFEANTLPSLVFAKYYSSSLYSNLNSSIIFISSVATVIGEPGLAAYSAAKGALNSAVRSIAVELAPKGIRVNCISPGWVETLHAQEVRAKIGEVKVEQIEKNYPLGFGQPRDISGICKFLVSDDSRWITGQNIIVDGGRSLV
jgi:NAD(P)-dependent dehydrogenase (short-subunit alcohol dehydrogenase family)